MARKEEKRKIILEKSLELFREKGYHDTKVEEITKALEISKGNFYTYFSSKEEVLYEILNMLKEEKIEILKGIDTSKEPEEILEEFINRRNEMHLKYMKKVNLQNAEIFLKDEKIIMHLEKIKKVSVDFLEENIVKRRSDESDKSYNSRFISEFIFLLVEEFFFAESLIGSPDMDMRYNLTRKEKINQIIEFIHNGLK